MYLARFLMVSLLVSSMYVESERTHIQASTFYITFTVIGYTAYALEIIQGAPLVINFVKRKLFNFTPRAKYALDQPRTFDFMFSYATLIVTFLITTTYCIVAPLITPFAFMLFGVAYLVLKYQFFYVYETQVESGGTWWPKMFNLLCLCIGIFQLMTFGSIVIISASRSTTGNGKTASLLVGLLCFVTFFVWIGMYMYFNRRANDMGVISDTLTAGELDAHICDPAMGQPLEKVWVRAPYDQQVPAEYTPEFRSTEDYMARQKLQGPLYQTHRRRMAKRLIAFGIHKEQEWEGQPLDIQRPPELEMAMNYLRRKYSHGKTLQWSPSETTLSPESPVIMALGFS